MDSMKIRKLLVYQKAQIILSDDTENDN